MSDVFLFLSFALLTYNILFLVFKKKNAISVRICQEEDGKLHAAFMCAINLLITDKSSPLFFLTLILIIHFSETKFAERVKESYVSC